MGGLDSEGRRDKDGGDKHRGDQLGRHSGAARVWHGRGMRLDARAREQRRGKERDVVVGSRG